MKRQLLVIGTLLLIGAGCANQPSTSNTAKVSESNTQTEQNVEVLGISIPKDDVLLPKKQTWRVVEMKNFDHPYTLEIHPWWQWDGSSAKIKNFGALLASSKSFLLDFPPTTNGHKIIWYSSSESPFDSLDSAMKAAHILSCDIFKKTVNGFEVCASKPSEGADVRATAVAYMKKGDFVWIPQLVVSDPLDYGLGYFLHALESFKEVTKKK